MSSITVRTWSTACFDKEIWYHWCPAKHHQHPCSAWCYNLNLWWSDLHTTVLIPGKADLTDSHLLPPIHMMWHNFILLHSWKKESTGSMTSFRSGNGLICWCVKLPKASYWSTYFFRNCLWYFCMTKLATKTTSVMHGCITLKIMKSKMHHQHKVSCSSTSTGQYIKLVIFGASQLSFSKFAQSLWLMDGNRSPEVSGSQFGLYCSSMYMPGLM